MSKFTRTSSYQLQANTLLGILGLAITLQFTTVLLFGGLNWDIESYRIVGEHVVNGVNFYVEAPSRYRYFPGWALIEAATVTLSTLTHLPFRILIRLPIIAADVGVVVAIYWLLSTDTAPGSLSPTKGALLHAINPAAIFITSVHGQFDAVAFLGLFIAIGLAADDRWYESALVFGLGIAIKQSILLLGPLFLVAAPTHRRRVEYLCLAGLPAVVLSLPYIVWSAPTFFEVVFRAGRPFLGWYNALAELLHLDWYTLIPEKHAAVRWSKRLLAVSVIMLSGYYYQRRQSLNLVSGAFAVVLLYFIIYVSLAPQYLYWLMPFLALLSVSNSLRAWTIMTGLMVYLWAWQGTLGIPVKFEPGLHLAADVLVVVVTLALLTEVYGKRILDHIDTA